MVDMMYVCPGFGESNLDMIPKGQLALPASTSQRVKSNQMWTYKLYITHWYTYVLVSWYFIPSVHSISPFHRLDAPLSLAFECWNSNKSIYTGEVSHQFSVHCSIFQNFLEPGWFNYNTCSQIYWLEKVRYGWTIPNSCENSPQALFSLWYMVRRWFKDVWQDQITLNLFPLW